MNCSKECERNTLYNLRELFSVTHRAVENTGRLRWWLKRSRPSEAFGRYSRHLLTAPFREPRRMALHSPGLSSLVVHPGAVRHTSIATMRNFAALRASPSWHGLSAAVIRIFVSVRPSRQGRLVTESVRGKAFATSASLSKRLTIRVPEMAESISEGTIVAFQRNVNDIVDANDELATIETDKVDVTVESPEHGCVIQFLVAEGETVVVGQEFAVIETKPNRGSLTRAEDEIAQNQSLLDRVNPDMDRPVAQDRKVQPQSSPSLPEQEEFNALRSTGRTSQIPSDHLTPSIAGTKPKHFATIQGRQS